MTDKPSAADDAAASRLAVFEADDLVRTLGSMLRTATWLLDNHFADAEPPATGPELDDVARQLELGYRLCDRIREILEPHDLLPGEYGRVRGRKSPQGQTQTA